MFREEIEKQGKEKKPKNMKELEERFKITANITLKNKYNRKRGKNTEEREPVWMTEQIRTKIKERKRWNKKKKECSEQRRTRKVEKDV